MATRRPIVLVSGVQAELPNSDGIYAASINSSTFTASTLTGSTISGVSLLGNTANITSLVASSVTGSIANITTVAGTTISGASVLGNTGSFTSLSGGTVIGNTLSAPSITGTTSISGATVQGSAATFTNVTGTTTVSGASFLGNSATISNVTGTTSLSGTSVLGSTAVFTNVTGTTAVSGTSILGNSAIISNVTGVTTVSGASLLGNASTISTTSSAGSFNPTGSSVPSNGLYLPSANTVAIASNSIPRVSFGGTEVVFNDGAENCDFRVEGDTDANLLFLDASADLIGVGKSNPSFKFDINGGFRVSGGGTTAFSVASTAPDNSLLVSASTGIVLVGVASATGSREFQLASGFSANSNRSSSFAKSLALSDNVSTTYFTIAIPAFVDFADVLSVGVEVSYVVTAHRQTSGRGATATYGKVYLAISRYWESSTVAPIVTALTTTDQALAFADQGFDPTITWSVSQDAGTDQAAKNVYLAVTVDNTAPGTIVQRIDGTALMNYYTTRSTIGIS